MERAEQITKRARFRSKWSSRRLLILKTLLSSISNTRHGRSIIKSIALTAKVERLVDGFSRWRRRRRRWSNRLASTAFSGIAVAPTAR